MIADLDPTNLYPHPLLRPTWDDQVEVLMNIMTTTGLNPNQFSAGFAVLHKQHDSEPERGCVLCTGRIFNLKPFATQEEIDRVVSSCSNSGKQYAVISGGTRLRVLESIMSAGPLIQAPFHSLRDPISGRFLLHNVRCYPGSLTPLEVGLLIRSRNVTPVTSAPRLH
jgi:hypothetical protein